MELACTHFSEKQLLVTKEPSLQGDDVESKRQEVLNYFLKTFALDEKLYETLADENSFLSKGSPLRHPLIFYYGHTAVFYVNKLFIAGLIDERLSEKIESMCAIGVDEMSWDDLNEGNYDWPSLNSIKDYRQNVKELVTEVILSAPLTLPITWNDPFWIVMMGIAHQRIHIETSSVLIRQLPLEKVKSVDMFKVCPYQGMAPQNAMVSFTGGDVALGKEKSNPYYGWDNEYGHKKVTVSSFKASQYLVSNQEYFEFIQEGGYQNDSYWTDEGVSWKSYTQADKPCFWVNKGETYYYRTLTEEIPMPWNWPVDINHLEAKAFCNWKSKKENKKIRMPSEAEWMLMRNSMDLDQPTWPEAPGNINLEYWASACPVDQFKSSSGVYDLIGNVWQWTESPIAPFNGFEVHPDYDDFSVPTFDQKHNLIKGGSYFSTGNYALKDSRYAFRRHFFQHAGLRYIESEKEVKMEAINPYEKDELINQYLEFHYGDEHFQVKNFAKACVDRSSKYFNNTSRALDLGCAVGRSAFEFAKHFDHVDAIDFSARFIQNASQLQQTGNKKYQIPIEGDIHQLKTIDMDQLGLAETAHKCVFMQSDACNLNDKFSDYDFIFAGNLIDRLYSPKLFLESIHERLNSGGRLILTSPYTWLEEYTPKNEWLGGYKKNGENQLTLQGLKEVLSSQFKLLATEDVEFVIRETARKFQHTVAQMTIWEKKDL